MTICPGLRTSQCDFTRKKQRRFQSIARKHGDLWTFTPPSCQEYQEWPGQAKPKKGQFMNFSQGHSGTKVQCESCLFS